MKVNDIHSRLNETDVSEIVEVDSLATLQRAVARASARGEGLALAGGRHSMGGQQFATGACLLDMRGLSAVLGFDRDTGVVDVESGIQWPALVEGLIAEQAGDDRQWSIAQKQTGADRFTIGGSAAVNCHGRGLTMQPLVGNIESLTIVAADGELLTCTRTQNPELFSLVVGGYGLFGAIYSVGLRLVPRRKLERVVEIVTTDDLEGRFDERISDGFVYGDFQFATDPASDDFLYRGVFSCYRPVPDAAPIPEDQRALSREEWGRLLVLAHTEKARAFAEYAEHYLATSGQIYWSDLHQFGEYTDGYHAQLDQLLGSSAPATEMISELYVPRDRLCDFLSTIADDFRRDAVDVIYGTVRLIERDDESFLAWARESYACVIFNLHTVHTGEGIAHSAAAFRRLIDYASERGGSYFPTYHRWATREQVEHCYPQFEAFLDRKHRYDPAGVFQSDWYRHHVRLFEEG